jgi:hypothetical protein
MCLQPEIVKKGDRRRSSNKKKKGSRLLFFPFLSARAQISAARGQNTERSELQKMESEKQGERRLLFYTHA